MVDAVNIFENLYQIIKFQIKLKYSVNRVMTHSQMLGKIEYTLPAKF